MFEQFFNQTSNLTQICNYSNGCGEEITKDDILVVAVIFTSLLIIGMYLTTVMVHKAKKYLFTTNQHITNIGEYKIKVITVLQSRFYLLILFLK